MISLESDIIVYWSQETRTIAYTDFDPFKLCQMSYL